MSSSILSGLFAALASTIDKTNKLGEPRPQINGLCDIGEICRPNFVLEKNMTVLRKGPTMPLTLEMFQFQENLENINPLTEGTAVLATFYGNYMDQSSNYTPNAASVLTDITLTGHGTAVDGSDISEFYTRGKVQKTTGDEFKIPIDITQSGEDWKNGDQLTIKHDYVDIYGNQQTANARVEIIEAAQSREMPDPTGNESSNWIVAPWSPYSVHGDGTSAQLPINNPFSITGQAATWGMFKLPGMGTDKFVRTRILSISGRFPIDAIRSSDRYFVELVQIDPLFKVKFPRFSYRYKYEDGEYSVFAPWSEVAFIPKNFDYSPKKGYNLGMENNLRSLNVLNWRPKDCPEDVVQIDILYKESNSPNVYTVESFKHDDPIESGVENYWNTRGNGGHFGKYNIKTELIHKVVASNQLLRPWDNVPRKALAQEITANRLIYANYLQQYNIEKIHKSDGSMVSVKPKFLPSIEQLNPWEDEDNSFGEPAKSLKSQRTYQLGVVYRDKYGRETPVLTSQSGSLEIRKTGAKLQNRLSVMLDNDPPYWAESYTFYIKETSNEYYNIAMDRWYNAEDGGIWLSFPSVERNKINEDTNLILKKRHASDIFAEADVSYKVLSIKNNAPKFIKTDSKYWGSVPIMLPPPGWGDVGNWDTGMLHPTGLPLPNRMNVDVIAEYFDATILKGLTGFNGAQIRITQSPGMPSSFNAITNELTNNTNWYDVANVSYIGSPPQTYFDDDGNEVEIEGQPIRLARISLEQAFGDDAMFVESDSILNPNTVNTTNSNLSMTRGLSIEVRTKEEKDKARFDGRFFVKIHRDGNVEANIVEAQSVESDKFQVLQSKDIKYICMNHPGRQDWNHSSTYYIPPSKNFDTATQDQTYLVSSFSKSVTGFTASYIDNAGATKTFPQSSPFWPFGPGSFTNGVYDTPGPSGNYWNNKNLDYLDNSDNFEDFQSNPNDWPSFGPHSLSWEPTCIWGVGANEYSNIDSGSGQYSYLDGSGSYPKFGVLDLTGGYKGGASNFPNGQSLSGVNPNASWGSSNYSGNVILGSSFSNSTGYISGANPFMIPAIWGNQEDFLVSASTCGGGSWPRGCQPHFDTNTMAKLRQHWYNLWRGRDDIHDTWPLGRFHPDRWFFDKVGAAQGGSGNGIWNDGDVSYMHLSYWGIGKENVYNREPNTLLAAKHQPTELLFGDAMSTIGTTFRFKQDPDQTVYTITSVQVEPEIWNYEQPRGSWGYADPDDPTQAIGGGGVFQGQFPPFGGKQLESSYLAGKTAFLSDVVMKDSGLNRSKLTGGAPYNRRVRYTIKLDKIIGAEGPNAFHPITNHVDADGRANIKRGRQKYSTDLGSGITTAVGATPGGIDFYNLNSYWNAVDNAGDGKNQQPALLANSWYDDNPNAYIGLHERGLNETTIEIISEYTGKDKDFPISNNPAIWETEPKEDVGLDIYYAASPSFPIRLKRNRWDGNKLSPLTGVGEGADEINPYVADIKHAANWYDYSDRGEEIIKVGSTIKVVDGASEDFQTMRVCDVKGDLIFIDRVVQITDYGDPTDPDDDTAVIQDMGVGWKLRFTWHGEGTYYGVTKDEEWVELYITEKLSNSVYRVGERPNTDRSHKVRHGLSYFNCYSFGTGVESNRIRDDFNAVTIDKGVKASMPLAEQFEEERKGSGLIFSGIYNSTSGINRTNQFIQAEPITKDLNPINGSIQKLFSRDTDLVTFCENKVFKILAKKDALFNADGNTNVTSNQAVLGQSIPFSGEYGISRNPESFASESYRVYFTDKDRGAVLRLSKDGLTPISDAGMKDWFRDNLRFSTSLIGSHDDRDDQYNLTIETSDQDGIEKAFTVSYTEKTRGWVSFKSFIQQGGISHKNIYYTFPSNTYNTIETNDPWGVPYSGTNSGEAHQHSLDIILKRLVTNAVAGINVMQVLDGNGVILPGMNVEGDGIPTDTRVESVACDAGVCNVVLDLYPFLSGNTGVWVNPNTEITFTTARNRFYDRDHYSMVKVLFNGDQGSVKRFRTLNYEGSQAKIEYSADPMDNVGNVYQIDGQVIGQDYYDNWPKKGWYVHNLHTDLQEGRLSEFIDKENKWFNYIRGHEDAGQGDFLDTGEFSLQGLGFSNSNVVVVFGCTDSNAGNYDPAATVDNGSCVSGTECTDPLAINYNITATADCNGNPLGSKEPGWNDCCNPFVYGCLNDVNAYNYNCEAGVSFSNIPNSGGCDASDNISTPFGGGSTLNVNTDDGSCFPVNTGCMDPNMFNYQAPIGDPQVDLNTRCVDNTGATNGTAFDFATSDTDGDSIDDTNILNFTCCRPIVTGCLSNPNSINYGCPTGNNNAANINNVSPCTVSGGMNVVATDPYTNVLTYVNTDDGSCIPWVYGCTQLDDGSGNPYVNYNPLATYDDGTCSLQVDGCTDPNASNYDFNANNDDGSCTYAGCTDPGASNYGQAPNYNGWNNDVSSNPAVAADGDAYDPTGNGGFAEDDGTCNFAIVGCMNGSPTYPQISSNYNPAAQVPCANCCVPCDYGCTDPSAFNYDASHTCDDGSCVPIISGCMDPIAANYNANVNTDNGSCIYLGCTDNTVGVNPDINGDCLDSTNCSTLGCCGASNGYAAENYDPSANVNNGTCSYGGVPGCTDPLAVNYDPNATVNNGTCNYLLPDCPVLANYLDTWFEQTHDLQLNQHMFTLELPNWLLGMTNTMQWTLSIGTSGIPYNTWHGSTTQNGTMSDDTTTIMSKWLGQGNYSLQIIFEDSNSNVCDITIKFHFWNGNIPGPVTIAVN